MSDIRNEVITLILSRLKLMRLYPLERDKFAYVMLILVSISRCIHITLACKLIEKNNDSVVIMAKGARTVGFNMQGLKIVALLQEHKMLYLLQNMDKFWHSEQAEVVYKQSKWFVLLFTRMVYVAYIFIVILPIVFGILPMDGDFPTFPYSFWVFGLLQALQLVYDVCVVLTTDCLFLTLSMFIYVQFKMLNKRIRQLGFENLKIIKEANICVQYHSFLLKFAETFSSMYSWTLLVQYVMTTLTACIEIYVLPKQELSQIPASIVYIFAQTVQLALYCFSADFVVQEALEVSEAIINSNWYNHPKFARIYVQHILRRAHRKPTFTAAGMARIDKVAFTMIFKWAISLYTLVRDIEKNID